MSDRPKLHVNLAWLYAGNFAAKLLSMGAFMFLMRRLGKGTFADLEFAYSVWIVLMLVQDAGLGPYGNREGAKRPGAMRELAGTVVSLQFCAFGLSMVLLTAFLTVLDRPPEVETLVALFAGVLAFSPLEVIWAFQSRDETGVVALTELMRCAIVAGMVVAIVRIPGDVYWVPAAEATGLAAAVLVQHVVLRRRIGAIVFHGALRRARAAVRSALPLAASSLTWALRTQLPFLALYVFTGSENSADYAAAQRFVIPAHFFVFLYSFNLLPSLSRAAQQPDRAEYRRLMTTSVRLVGWTVLPGCLAVTTIAPLVFPKLAGTQFASGVLPFQIMVWMLGVAFFTFHLRYALVAFDRQKDELWSMVVGLAVGGVALVLIGDRLTPVTAALVFVGSEAACLLAAERLLALRVEPARALRGALRPVLATAAAGALSLGLLGDTPVLATVTALVLCACGLFLLDRALVTEARAVLRGGR